MTKTPPEKYYKIPCILLTSGIKYDIIIMYGYLYVYANIKSRKRLKMTEYSRLTCSPDETEKFGGEIARTALENKIDFIAMYGGLGAGKTAFVRGMAQSLAPGAHVSSPTYSIVNEIYPVGGKRPVLFHFDMYRVESEDDLDSIDFDSYFLRGAMIVCEWSENIEFALPERYLRVDIEKLDENSRKISVREVSREK